MDEKLFDIFKINQNGFKVIEQRAVTSYTAHKLCREYNNLLKSYNPFKLRKYVTEEATE